jgi:hypothetical protein
MQLWPGSVCVQAQQPAGRAVQSGWRRPGRWAAAAQQSRAAGAATAAAASLAAASAAAVGTHRPGWTGQQSGPRRPRTACPCHLRYTRDHNVFVACTEPEAEQHLRMRMIPSPSSRTALTASATDGACTGPCADGVMDGRFDCGSCSTAHKVQCCHRRASSTCTGVNTAYNMLVTRTEVPAHTLVPQFLTRCSLSCVLSLPMPSSWLASAAAAFAGPASEPSEGPHASAPVTSCRIAMAAAAAHHYRW